MNTSAKIIDRRPTKSGRKLEATYTWVSLMEPFPCSTDDFPNVQPVDESDSEDSQQRAKAVLNLLTTATSNDLELDYTARKTSALPDLRGINREPPPVTSPPKITNTENNQMAEPSGQVQRETPEAIIDGNVELTRSLHKLRDQIGERKRVLAVDHSLSFASSSEVDNNLSEQAADPTKMITQEAATVPTGQGTPSGSRPSSPRSKVPAMQDKIKSVRRNRNKARIETIRSDLASEGSECARKDLNSSSLEQHRDSPVDETIILPPRSPRAHNTAGSKSSSLEQHRDSPVDETISLPPRSPRAHNTAGSKSSLEQHRDSPVDETIISPPRSPRAHNPAGSKPRRTKLVAASPDRRTPAATSCLPWSERKASPGGVKTMAGAHRLTSGLPPLARIVRRKPNDKKPMSPMSRPEVANILSDLLSSRSEVTTDTDNQKSPDASSYASSRRLRRKSPSPYLAAGFSSGSSFVSATTKSSQSWTTQSCDDRVGRTEQLLVEQMQVNPVIKAQADLLYAVIQQHEERHGNSYDSSSTRFQNRMVLDPRIKEELDRLYNLLLNGTFEGVDSRTSSFSDGEEEGIEMVENSSTNEVDDDDDSYERSVVDEEDLLYSGTDPPEIDEELGCCRGAFGCGPLNLFNRRTFMAPGVDAYQDQFHNGSLVHASTSELGITTTKSESSKYSL